ncbi:TonB-dependent receptor plug domain-containing protein [Caulobacter sp. KR2-114]|uniref:TonB-dependent receptor plug domain-containing protein n=1 Tax=Caulobacter sp. KR2-114 TaxID=3400912 RepID=UPI003C0FA4EA
MKTSRKALLAVSVYASAAAVAALFATPALAADAQAGAAASTANDNTNVDQVVVIGTRRSDRSVTTSPSPVDVISNAELQQQPAGNMLDQIRNIVPSFFVPQNTISDASSFVRAPSLRGLPGDEVLVMLNGKRYNRSALVQVYTGGDTGLSFGSQGSDLSAIPAIAVKNLEVLRDGATAQYGTDAIAGVLNYGLRDNSRGVEVDARYGQYYQNGDGQSKQISANAGFGLGERAFVNISGEYDHDDGTSRGATRPLAALLAQTNPNLASQIPNYPLPAQIWGSSPSHGYKLLANAGIDVTENSKLYGFINYAWSHTNESFNYRPVNSGTFLDSAGVSHTLNPNGALANTFYLTPCPAANATCPATGFISTGSTFSFQSLYPAGFTPRFIGETEELYGTVGYKGKTGFGLSYDLSGTLSRNTLDLSMTGSLSPSYGPNSQTSFKFGNLIQKETDVNLDLSYPWAVGGLASPVTLSGGAEYRRESYTQTAGDVQSYGAGPYAVAQQLYAPTATPGVYTFAGTNNAMSPGASGYGGTSPAAAGTWSQTSYALYGDAEADLVQNFSVGAAVRYEHYDTFGGTAVFKINGIYKFTDQFSFRATVGTGFHAPSPGQSNDEILTTNFVAGNQVQTGTYPVTSAIAQYYGASTLKPEKSTNVGAGVIFKPTPSTVITADAYYIKVNNRIGISQNFTVLAGDVIAQPALAAVGVGGAVNYFTNGFDTETHGLDVVATHHTEALGGRLNLTFAYNYNVSNVTKFDPAVISAAQITDVARLAPAHRIVASANWSMGPWSVNARENFYSSWRDEVDYPGQKFGAKGTTDLDVSYAFGGEHYTFTAGVLNLFNAHPDRIAQSSSNPIYPITGSTADGQIYPRSGGPFGINGGFWYVRLRAKY